MGVQFSRDITVVLRYDDFGLRSDTALERRIVGALARQGLCAVFGVIPFDTESQPLSSDAEKAAFLRTAVGEGLVEAALHGFCHEFLEVLDGGKTEFAGRGAGAQLEMIRRGAEELEACCGRYPSCFIPPFNSYDLDTVRALEGSGITCLSASMFGPAPENSNLRFLPQTCSLVQVRDAVEAARQGRTPFPLLMPLFHQFDFTENDPVRGRLSFEAFEKLLAWLADQADVRVCTVSGVLGDGHDLGAGRHLAQRAYLLASLHPWSAPWAAIESARLLLHGPSEAQVLRRMVVARTAAAYVAVALAGFFAGACVSAVGIPWALSTSLAVAGLTALGALTMARKGRMYFRAVAAAVFLAAFAAGSLTGS